MEPILGIDLGTTNSVVAVLEEGEPRVIANPETGERILPSVVGIDLAGEILVGTPARNQAALYPERTIVSVKRQMGRDVELSLGPQRLSPPEVSAIILRTLAQWAQADLGRPVTKAVITVPAFFNDAQREATRRAGELAGLEVVRIINEPTAASLVYEPGTEQQQRILVYDLGGGTFDVSIVSLEGDVVEVLSSHGDTQLGGDDFDHLLANHLGDRIEGDVQFDSRTDAAAAARLRMAAEEAKKRLSFETFTAVREEFLKSGEHDVHLDVEVDRSELETLIATSLEQTIHCVDRALEDAGLHAGQLDRVILVGGSTRIPLVGDLLAQRLGQPPTAEIDPDICVALGAAIQGGLIAGQRIDRVLVDITPHTLGIRVLDSVAPYLRNTAFAPIIVRRTPLPATRAKTFFTSCDGQTRVEIDVYQGEHNDVRQNQLIGSVNLEDLSPHAPEGSPISVQFTLNLNGILEVRAVDRTTGKQATARLQRTAAPDEEETAADNQAARERIEGLLGQSIAEPAGAAGSADPSTEAGGGREASPLRQRWQEMKMAAERVRVAASEEDAQEIDALLENLRELAATDAEPEFAEGAAELNDLLFYLEEA